VLHFELLTFTPLHKMYAVTFTWNMCVKNGY